jgi:hypothetical protein
MPLYYVVLDANDSIKHKESIPAGYSGKRFVLAVEAETEEAAHALIPDSFERLADSKDFGEVRAAVPYKKAGDPDTPVKRWIMMLPDPE